MDIVLYPDPRLRAKNAPVEAFDADLEALARRMFEAMYRTGGVGLAAPQVGVNRCLLVYNATGKPEEADQEVVLCNPRLAWKAKEKESGEEGCLSFPEISGHIERPVKVRIEAQDLAGTPFEMELEDWEARIFLHEFDHLDGILFIDRMTPADKALAKPRLSDMTREYQESVAHPPRA
jgi:peptide deformylase